MARSDVVDITVEILINRIKGGEWGNSEIERLVEELADLYKVEIDTSDINGVIRFLEELPQEETIGEIKEEIERAKKPKTKLSQSEINELIVLRDESINASNEKRERIQKRLDEFQKKAPGEAEKIIGRIRENLKNNPPLTPPLTHPRGQASKGEKVDVVEEFVEKVGGLDEDKKRTIRLIINKTINGEPTPKGIENKEIEIVVKDFVITKKEELKQRKLDEIRETFDSAATKAPEDQKELIKKYGENLIKLNRVETPNFEKDMSDVQVMMEANGVNPGTIERASNDVKILIKTIYTKPSELKKIYEEVKSLDVGGLQQKYLPNLGGVRSFQSWVRAVDVDKSAMLGLQNMVHGKVKIIEGFGKVISKFPGGSSLVTGITEKIGGVAMKEFMAGAMKVMAEQGMLTGGKAILQGIISGTAATAETAAGSTLLASTVAAFQSIPVIGQIILILALLLAAAQFLYKIAVGLYNSASVWLKKNTGLNLWAIRDGFTNLFGENWFGRGVGTLAQFGFNGLMFGGALVMGGLAALFGPILAVGLATMTALIVPVVTFFAVGMMAYGVLVDMPKISSLVPPPPEGAGGECRPKGEEEESGKINCRVDAPPSNTGISKEAFVDLANRWSAGTNYADKCFDDVVNRALCAGVNPQYALWAWLHESGASNYDIDNVEDFGIHGNQSVPTKNFDKQITKFLTLDPGTACKDLPYWLSFATNYLTGECDPKKGIVQADGTLMTGEKYLAEITEQWSWIKPGSSLPGSIKISSGGSQCNGSSTENPNEYVRADGVLMECDGPVDENGNFIGQDGSSNYDPNASGLVGEKVAGECSVASKVIETKQCGQSWSNKGLPGGSGTICSAGCGPSSASSILRSINGSLTPDTLIFESGSPYNSMNGNGSSLGQAKQSLAKHGVSNTGAVGGCSQKDIAAWICQGKAVVILSDSYTGSGGGTIGHILVVVAVQGGKLITKDPYYGNTTPFVTEGGIKAGQIKNLRECLTVQLTKD